MAFSYSGSVDVSRGIAKVFTNSTYYSFQLTEACRIGIDGNPLVNFKSGDEFIIQVDSTYIFDRDTTISLSYPASDPVADFNEAVYALPFSSSNLSTSEWQPVRTLTLDRDFSSYDIFATIMLEDGYGGRSSYLRVRRGSSILALQSIYITDIDPQYEAYQIKSSSTTPIYKDDVLFLEFRGTGHNVYYGFGGNVILRITDNT